MQPGQSNTPQNRNSQPYRRSIQPLPSGHDPSRRLGTNAATRAAATELMRNQIDQIYDTSPPHKEAVEAIQAQQANAPAVQTTDTTVYGKTHSTPTAATQSPEELKQYHSAWQNYYKQYYERYYLHQIHATRTQLEARAQAAAQPIAPTPHTPEPAQETSLTPEQAISELRNNLLDKVRQQATKARKSRHFMPIVSALAVGLVFAFLQYNRLLVAQVYAYVSPGSINPQNIVLDPTTELKVSKDPRLIIPKINVDAPVVYGVESIAEGPIQAALEGGVVHYPIPGANSLPGQAGNSVLLGHSSNDVFNNGGYKFIFVQLDQLNKGDTFYVHYKGTRYTYSVTDKEIIEPTAIGKLTKKTSKPTMTLITCTPPGTALKRLIVIGEQISPDPAGAASAPKQDNNSKEPTQLPANAPTLLERLFGQQ